MRRWRVEEESPMNKQLCTHHSAADDISESIAYITKPCMIEIMTKDG